MVLLVEALWSTLLVVISVLLFGSRLKQAERVLGVALEYLSQGKRERSRKCGPGLLHISERRKVAMWTGVLRYAWRRVAVSRDPGLGCQLMYM